MNLIAVILVLLNGQAISFQGVQPVNDNGTVLVPVRGVFQAMGAQVEYNPVTRNVTAVKDGRKIEMAVGRLNAWANGEEVQLPTPVRVQDGHVLIPARFVAEALGAQVRWNAKKNRLLISTDTAAPLAKPVVASDADPIRVTFFPDKRSYGKGEAVNFTLIARNTSKEDQTLNFRSGQNFDISVTPANQNEVLWRWDWSFGRFFTDATRATTLKPNQSISLSAVWKQTDNSGKPMPPGDYIVDATVTANDEIKANSVSIKLNE